MQRERQKTLQGVDERVRLNSQEVICFYQVQYGTRLVLQLVYSALVF